MNMRSLNRYTASILLVCFFSALSFSSCKEKEEFTNAYELDGFNAYPNNAGKIKLKTDEQWIAVLYANLFQKAISTRLLSEMIDAIYSVGDKEVAHEMIVAKFLAQPGLKIPSNTEMRADIDQFLKDSYKRFFVRNITEAERTWFKNYIINTPEVTVEFVFTAFALSDEYEFY